MPTKYTITVQVIKNQTNSSALFKEWNKKGKANIKCSKIECSNDAKNSAYIVIKPGNENKKFILPLCEECYETEDNSIDNSTQDFTDLGSIITIEQELLVEYTV